MLSIKQQALRLHAIAEAMGLPAFRMWLDEKYGQPDYSGSFKSVWFIGDLAVKLPDVWCGCGGSVPHTFNDLGVWIDVAPQLRKYLLPILMATEDGVLIQRRFTQSICRCYEGVRRKAGKLGLSDGTGHNHYHEGKRPIWFDYGT